MVCKIRFFLKEKKRKKYHQSRLYNDISQVCELNKEETIYFENDIAYTYISIFFPFKKSDPGMGVLNTLHT